MQEREQARGGAGGELVGVVAGGNVQPVEVGNDRTRQVDSNRMEGGRSFHIDSGEAEDHMWQAGRVVGCDNGVKEVAAVVQCAHTDNCHDGRTECGRRVVGSGKLGWPAAVAEVAGSELGESFQEEMVV